MRKGTFWPSQNNRPRDLDSRAAQAPVKEARKLGYLLPFPRFAMYWSDSSEWNAICWSDSPEWKEVVPVDNVSFQDRLLVNYVLVDVRVPSKYYKPDNWTRREHKRVLFTFLRFYYYYYYYIIRLWLVLGIAVPAAAIIFFENQPG